jgi:hypothetical protein
VEERDWKLFKDKIGLWQEAYMERLISEYMILLEDEQPASIKFWALEKKIRADKKKQGVCISLSRSKMMFDIVDLIRDGVITKDDLEDFSETLKENVETLL